MRGQIRWFKTVCGKSLDLAKDLMQSLCPGLGPCQGWICRLCIYSVRQGPFTSIISFSLRLPSHTPGLMVRAISPELCAMIIQTWMEVYTKKWGCMACTGLFRGQGDGRCDHIPRPVHQEVIIMSISAPAMLNSFWIPQLQDFLQAQCMNIICCLKLFNCTVAHLAWSQSPTLLAYPPRA